MDSTFTFSFIASTWKGNSERQLKEEKKTKWKSPTIETDREKNKQTTCHKHKIPERDAGNNATFDTNADLRLLWNCEFFLCCLRQDKIENTGVDE